MSAEPQSRQSVSSQFSPTVGELADQLQSYLRERGFVAVKVAAQDGKLALTGEVSTPYERLLAMQAVQRLRIDRPIVDCLAVAGSPAKPRPSLWSAGTGLVRELTRDFAADLGSQDGRKLVRQRLLPGGGLALALILLVAWKFAAAPEPGIPVVPVTGSVNFEGAVPVGAQLIFHPQGHALPEGAAAMGKVAADGTFQASLSAQEPGLPPGNYRVTLSWFRPLPTSDGGRRNCFPSRYAKPDSSPVQVNVTGDSPLTLPPIQISRRG